MVVAVLTDEQHRIHSQTISAERERGTNALVDGNIRSDLPTNIILVDLVNEERSELSARRNQSIVGRKATQEFGNYHTGMAVRKKGCYVEKVLEYLLKPLAIK